MDAQPEKYIFNNAAMFYNEPLPFREELIKAFKDYCIENSYPITITKNNEGILINAIKAYIAIQLFGENLYNRIVNEKDPFIQKTLTEIKTP